MTKRNKTEYVALRMTEPQLSQLDYIREPGETRSACIRRLVNEKWFELMMVAHEDYPSISDRVNCL